MKIENKTGMAHGTKVFTDDGVEIGGDMCITNISLDFNPGDFVKAEITCLKPTVLTDVPPENMFIIQDTALLDGALSLVDALFIHNMSKDVRVGLENVYKIIDAQIKDMKKT